MREREEVSGVCNSEDIPGHTVTCVLCVQLIAESQKELKRPSINKKTKMMLQLNVQRCETDINGCKSFISSCDADIRKHHNDIAALQGVLYQGQLSFYKKRVYSFYSSHDSFCYC